MSLRERLQDREKKLGAIRVGLVGAGQMGTGLISQIEKMVGMRVMVAADVMPNRAVDAYKESDVNAGDIVPLDENAQKASDLIMSGKRIATTNADFLVSIGVLDVIVECTGIPEIGARVCYSAIEAGKSVVNMNVETDATIGYILAKKAKEKNVTYTLVAGDEPGSIKEMVDFAEALGFEVAAVGKGKNNFLDRTANPDNVAQKANTQKMSPKMLASFLDGTKTMVEMTSIGNGLGFAPEVLGAYGPTCDVKDLPNVFVPKSAGGIFNGRGAVDYAIGNVAPGVFVIITTDQPKIIRDLRYLRLLGNPFHNYWALYRPYHLCNLEAPISIVRVALDNEVTLATYRKPVAETVTIAKKELKPGDKIDALGGFTVYGLIDRVDHTQKEDMLPLGLAVGGVMKKAVKSGEPVRYSDIDLVEEQVIVKLRREQDKLS